MDPFQPDRCSLSQMDTEQQRPDTQSVFILKKVKAHEAHLQAGTIVSFQGKWTGHIISEPGENSVIMSFLGDRMVICHPFSEVLNVFIVIFKNVKKFKPCSSPPDLKKPLG